jgi:hypothetical protein
MAAGTAGKGRWRQGYRVLIFLMQVGRYIIFEFEGAGGLGSHESFCAGKHNSILGPHASTNTYLSVSETQTLNLILGLLHSQPACTTMHPVCHISTAPYFFILQFSIPTSPHFITRVFFVPYAEKPSQTI